MSLILEALRKSEAQRRLGQAPGLHSPVPATPRRRRLPRWLLPALALMAVGAVAWWLGRLAVPDPGNGTETTVVIEPTPAPPPLPVDTATGGPQPAARPEPPAAPAASRPQPTPPPAQAAAAAATPAAPAEPAASPPPAPALAQPAAAAPVSPGAAVEPMPPEAADAPPHTDTGSVAADPGLMRLADLPAGVRGSLPELRISMHVYAEDPARRFAIIDGRRVGEGALLEGQGVVESIERDGIVVDFDGRRILLPRP